MASSQLALKDILCDERFNLYQTTKFLDWSKFKAFADDKTDLTENYKFVLGKEIKHCGKRRKCCLPAFYPFPAFSKDLSYRVIKSPD